MQCLILCRVAGSDTTSTAVQSTLLAIILNPHVYQTLRLEIQAAVKAKAVSYPIADREGKQLPYLQACVLEGLRKFPPLSQLRERVVPPEGDIINGHRIPGGTFIGLNAWGTRLDEVFGDDPEVFRPERWLTSDTNRLKAMHHTHGLIFGHGSTKCLGMAMAMMELNKIIFEVQTTRPSRHHPQRLIQRSCSGILKSQLPTRTSRGRVSATAYSSRKTSTYTLPEQTSNKGHWPELPKALTTRKRL